MQPQLDLMQLGLAHDPEQAIYAEMARNPRFAEGLARARAESAHGLAMQVIDIADSATAKDNPQLIKNRCGQRRRLAGEYNSAYSDNLAVTGADGGSIAERLAEMTAEQRFAWAAEAAAKARRLLEAPTIDNDDDPTTGRLARWLAAPGIVRGITRWS